MKLRTIAKTIGVLLAIACLGLSGCSSGGGTNVVAVSVTPSSGTALVNQVLTFTAMVTGGTTTTVTTVTWSCTFTTTTTTTTGTTTTTTTSNPAPCTSADGTLTNPQSNPDTIIYTAPAVVQNPAHTITITATADADKKKSGKAVITLDSGIRVTLNPPTATVPTNDTQPFTATNTNDPIANNVTWSCTYLPTSTSTATACTSAYGSVDANGVYTSPATVPTPATVTIVATSKADVTRTGSATVTIVQSGPITFSGIWPKVAPQGGVQQDIFLAATNITSKSSVTLDGQTVPSTQIRVLFGPASTTSSIGARLRLTANDLETAKSQVQIAISDPLLTGTTAYTFDVVPVSPALTASIPDSLPQSGNVNAMTIDGGFFGASTNPLISAVFNGAPRSVTASTPRQLSIDLNAGDLQTSGLYPVGIVSTSASPSSAFTNLAVFPDYSGANPAPPPGVIQLLPSPAPCSAAAPLVPSAIAMDTVLDLAVVAEAGANCVQLINMNGGSPTLGAAIPVGKTPTGVAVDESLHIAAVVNYGDNSLWVLQLPAGSVLAKIDLSQLTQITPPPSPTAVGIDPFNHLALVAFSSTNVGFIVQLGPAALAANCLASSVPPSAGIPYCATASVTLNTGAQPQIAFDRQSHLAYVTPGGAGLISVVDLTHASKQILIASALRTANSVQVTTATSHNIDPAKLGTVLISGLPNGTKGTNFNGSFQVTSVIDATNFTYSQVAADDSVTGAATSLVTYGSSFQTFSISNAVQGVAINPETRMAAFANPNASSSQIALIHTLDQNFTFINLTTGSIGSTSTGAPESGLTHVAFQPFTNTLVVFNPTSNQQGNQISLVDPVRQQRFAIIPTGFTGTATLPVTIGTSTTTLTIPGALAVDPSSNLALAVNSGSDTISVLQLGTTIKPVHIDRMVIPAGQGVPNSTLTQATLTSSNPLTGVTILGSGFASGVQVLLDATAPALTPYNVTSHSLQVDVPANLLSAPRHYALQVSSGGVLSNVTDFTVVQAIDMAFVCGGGAETTQPGAVAIDEQRNIAVVANGCVTISGTSTTANAGAVSIIDLTPGATNPLGSAIAVGTSPAGVAVISRFGLAVVTNYGSGTASVVNLDTTANPKVPLTTTVTVGAAPNGVAIDPNTGAAITANTGSNTISQIDLTKLNPLTSTAPGTLTPVSAAVDSQPIAVAIDPDHQVAVVTCVPLSGSSASGVLDVVNIDIATPIKNAALTASVSAIPTSIVFDPTYASSQSVFYVTSSQNNTITAFNAATGQTLNSRVGINPTSLAYNYQTGAILTVNSASNTISLVDAQTFKIRSTLGIGSSSQFAVAIHPWRNLAVIADQANSRVLLFPLPE